MICVVCLEDKPETSFPKRYHGAGYDRRKTTCEKCKYMGAYRRLRMMFLKEFEYKCQCCGEDDIRFLTADHVQNDGFKDRNLTPIQIYRKALDDNYDRKKWNCLCWNCNCGRGQNNGICPHKDKVSKENFLNHYLRLGVKVNLKRLADKIKESGLSLDELLKHNPS